MADAVERLVDEEGHRVLRGEAVAVCTGAAARPAAPPYGASFLVDPGGPLPVLERGCAPGAACG